MPEDRTRKQSPVCEIKSGKPFRNVQMPTVLLDLDRNKDNIRKLGVPDHDTDIILS